jgi:hypothetical protein
VPHPLFTCFRQGASSLLIILASVEMSWSSLTMELARFPLIFYSSTFEDDVNSIKNGRALCLAAYVHIRYSRSLSVHTLIAQSL